MNFRIVRRAVVYAVALLILISAIIGVEYAHRAHVHSLLEDAQAEQTLQFELARARVESVIFRDIYLSDALATYVATQPESTPAEWIPIARLMFEKAETIRNIGLAPNDVLSFIYPLAGNERAIGTNLRTIPAQASALARARESKQMVISGPVELVQGGVAIIARVPIFHSNDSSRYWGTASVVLDVDALLEVSGLATEETMAQIAIRGKDGLGAEGDVFLGEPSLFVYSNPTMTINLPNGSWQLTYAPINELPDSVTWVQQYLLRITGYAILFTAVIAFLYVLALLRVARAHSTVDLLTGLYNRRFISMYVNKQLQRKEGVKSKLAVLYLDLNGFKQVNDQQGHQAGDEVLIEVGRRISSVISTSDLVARLGGDEFLVVLGRIRNQEEAELVANRVRHEISDAPFILGEHQAVIGTSIGIATAPQDGKTFEALSKVADSRMYEEKRRSKVSR